MKKVSKKDINESNMFMCDLALKTGRKAEKFLAIKKISSKEVTVCICAKNVKYSKDLKPGKEMPSKFKPCL